MMANVSGAAAAAAAGFMIRHHGVEVLAVIEHRDGRLVRLDDERIPFPHERFAMGRSTGRRQHYGSRVTSTGPRNEPRFLGFIHTRDAQRSRTLCPDLLLSAPVRRHRPGTARGRDVGAATGSAATRRRASTICARCLPRLARPALNAL